MSHLLTVRQVAHELQVPISSIYYWISRSEIPHLKVGRHCRFVLSEVIDWFRKKNKGVRPCQATGTKLKGLVSSLKTENASREVSQEGESHGNY